MKLALETRKSNVEAINNLLNDIKAEGELANGQFPADVGEKIARLNADWQVIIGLAISLKTPINEEYIIMESVHMEESHEFNFLGKLGWFKFVFCLYLFLIFISMCISDIRQCVYSIFVSICFSDIHQCLDFRYSSVFGFPIFVSVCISDIRQYVYFWYSSVFVFPIFVSMCISDIHQCLYFLNSSGFVFPKFSGFVFPKFIRVCISDIHQCLYFWYSSVFVFPKFIRVCIS